MQDWSLVWAYFDDPQQLLLSDDEGFAKTVQELARNAVSEMRRYYSRKVVDVLTRVTRASLDLVIRRFADELEGNYNSYF